LMGLAGDIISSGPFQVVIWLGWQQPNFNGPYPILSLGKCVNP
jgi:hypothetical protein